MTSPKQIAANKTNSENSTGPRTPEGKKMVSKNALRHGGTAARGLLPDEDGDEYARFCESLHEAYAPCGPDQEILVGFIVDGVWRLRRLSRVEPGILTWHIYQKLEERIDQESVRPHLVSVAEKKAQLRRKQVTEIDLAAQAFLIDASGPDVLSKFSRYEGAIANRVLKWMRELRELQSSQIEPA